MKFWNSIKTWFRESLEAMEESAIATSMWVDGYSDFEIEEELRRVQKSVHKSGTAEEAGVCGSISSDVDSKRSTD